MHGPLPGRSRSRRNEPDRDLATVSTYTYHRARGLATSLGPRPRGVESERAVRGFARRGVASHYDSRPGRPWRAGQGWPARRTAPPANRQAHPQCQALARHLEVHRAVGTGRTGCACDLARWRGDAGRGDTRDLEPTAPQRRCDVVAERDGQRNQRRGGWVIRLQRRRAGEPGRKRADARCRDGQPQRHRDSIRAHAELGRRGGGLFEVVGMRPHDDLATDCGAQTRFGRAHRQAPQIRDPGRDAGRTVGRRCRRRQESLKPAQETSG